ncbi:MAG TPA: hypothetical protein VGH93_09540 [Solirubrobacteraceae bacterium]
MPRVVVTAEHTERGIAPVLLDEQVHAVHLSTEHSAKQFIERLGWAITYAESVETTNRPGERRGRAGEPAAHATRLAARHPVHA